MILPYVTCRHARKYDVGGHILYCASMERLPMVVCDVLEDVRRTPDEVMAIVPMTLSADLQRMGIPVTPVRWDDGGTPLLSVTDWQTFAEYRITIASCVGGHGRTGTTAAILLGLWLGLDAATAMELVRQVYCPVAIETDDQEEYVQMILQAARGIPPLRTTIITPSTVEKVRQQAHEDPFDNVTTHRRRPRTKGRGG